MQEFKVIFIALSAIIAFATSVLVVTFITSPFVVLDEKGRRMLATILGYVSIVSLSSILVTVVFTIFVMECVNYYFGRDLSVLRNIKSILLWVSGASGVFAALGFLAAALIPVIWWARVDYKDVGMYTGSVLLSSSAAGGVIGVLLGLTSAPYCVEFFNERSSETKGSRWEKHLSALGPGGIFLGISYVMYVWRVDAVHKFYSFGNDLLTSEGVSDCDKSGRVDTSIAVACVTKDLAKNEATIARTYCGIIILVILVFAIYRYVKSGEIMRIICDVRKFASDLSKYKRSQCRSKRDH